jgi:hypothetical protein
MAQSTRDKRKTERTQGITSISVSGYKALRDSSSIEVRPLTILAGANSSGKSSIIQPVLLLKQTLEASYDPGPLLLDGPNVRFTSTKQLLARLPHGKTADRFKIELGISDTFSYELTFIRMPQKGIQLESMTFGTDGHFTTISADMSSEQLLKVLPESTRNLQEVLGKRNDQTAFEWKVVRERCLLTVALLQTAPRGSVFSYTVPAWDYSLLEAQIRSLIHVPGLRGNPERTYKTTAIGDQFPGTFENYVASVISHWKSTKDDRLVELGRALETLGLTWKVDARQVDDTQVELLVGRLPHPARAGAQDLVSVADVGFGTSQVLPVLVALLTAKPGQLVHLEQPEIHLHPRAQAAMAQVLVDAAKRGVRVIAETHSSLLLLAIQTLIAEGSIAPDNVKLHWFKRGEDGATQIASTDLDDAGAFGDWPEDFGEVAMKTEMRYLDASEQRQVGQKND